uniref:Uncharacterized protein n=1 Tax=Caenorhabditis japonica TaxID=281687 RepID=A0A8R1I7V7_CAEJA
MFPDLSYGPETECILLEYKWTWMMTKRYLFFVLGGLCQYLEVHESDITRTDTEPDGTVYKNSYASLNNDLPPTTSFDDLRQSISNLTNIFRSSDTCERIKEKGLKGIHFFPFDEPASSRILLYVMTGNGDGC